MCMLMHWKLLSGVGSCCHDYVYQSFNAVKYILSSTFLTGIDCVVMEEESSKLSCRYSVRAPEPFFLLNAK